MSFLRMLELRGDCLNASIVSIIFFKALSFSLSALKLSDIFSYSSPPLMLFRDYFRQKPISFCAFFPLFIFLATFSHFKHPFCLAKSKKQWGITSQKSMIFDDCQSSLNFEALKGVVCKGTCFLDFKMSKTLG